MASLEVEVPSKNSVDKLLRLLLILTKSFQRSSPHLFKSIVTIEGKGNVETVKICTFGDGIPFTSGKFKVDSVDESNYSYNYSLIEGDSLQGADSVNHIVKVVPTADGGSVYKHSVIYNYKGDSKPPAEALQQEKEVYETAYKAVEAYVAEHPEAIN